MKYLSLFLSISSVASLDFLRSKIPEEEALSILEKIRSVKPGLMDDMLGSSKISSRYYTGDCFAEAEEIYNNTAIAVADPFTFLFTYNGTAFDLQEFFDELNFDAECDALGGQVLNTDFVVDCEGEGGTLENFKLCAPSSCGGAEFLFQLNFVYALMSAFIGCNMEFESDLVPSMSCLMDYHSMYNDTDIGDNEPFEFIFSRGGAEMVEESGRCKIITRDSDVQVCYLKSFAGWYGNIQSSCDSLGGQVFPIDVFMNAPFFHRSILKYPLCKPSSCDANDIKALANLMASMGSAELYYGAKPKQGEGEGDAEIEIRPSLSNSCNEFVNEKAFIKKGGKPERKKNSGVKARTCRWIAQRPADKKAKYCDKVDDGDSKFGVASEICPTTCCSCAEDANNQFLKSLWFGDDGTTNVVTRDCAWLQSIKNESKRNKYCKKRNAAYVGGLPPAYVACPETCGMCAAK